MFRWISITDQFSYMYKGNTHDLKLYFSGTRFMIRLALIDAVTNHMICCVFPFQTTWWLFRAGLHGGGGPRVGEVTHLGEVNN